MMIFPTCWEQYVSAGRIRAIGESGHSNAPTRSGGKSGGRAAKLDRPAHVMRLPESAVQTKGPPLGRPSCHVARQEPCRSATILPNDCPVQDAKGPSGGGRPTASRCFGLRGLCPRTHTHLV